jgi:hypothetical protein
MWPNTRIVVCKRPAVTRKPLFRAVIRFGRADPRETAVPEPESPHRVAPRSETGKPAARSPEGFAAP